MRRILVAVVLPVALFAAKAASAQSTVKIGYVDVQRAVQEVEDGKSARLRLQAELKDRQGQIEVKKTGLEKMKTEFDKQASVLSEEHKKKKMEEMQKAFIDAQTAAQQMQDDLTGKERDEMSKISARMIKIVNEVSEREHFSIVLDKGVLLYAPASSDITNEVVRAYNDKYVEKAAPEASKKAPAPKK